jgi:hypothetical protein
MRAAHLAVLLACLANAVGAAPGACHLALAHFISQTDANRDPTIAAINAATTQINADSDLLTGCTLTAMHVRYTDRLDLIHQTLSMLPNGLSVLGSLVDPPSLLNYTLCGIAYSHTQHTMRARRCAVCVHGARNDSGASLCEGGGVDTYGILLSEHRARWVGWAVHHRCDHQIRIVVITSLAQTQKARRCSSGPDRPTS